MIDSEPVIRLCQTSDADAVIALWQETLPSSQPWNEPRQALIRKLNRRDELVFVADIGGDVAGVVVTGYDGVRGWIYNLSVSPNHRRCGIGRDLLTHAETTLATLGCPKVNLQVRANNSNVLDFYGKCGFEKEDRVSMGKSLLDRLKLPADPVPEIVVSEKLTLSQMTPNDRKANTLHLSATREFRESTFRVPFPYTDLDSDQWLAQVTRESLSTDRSRQWAIRDSDGILIGGIGLAGMIEGEKGEIGYWLAKSWWGKGIMTAVVRRLCEFAFDRYRLHRIHAQVFSTNPRSARVLTKAGFLEEGVQRNHFFKNGKPIDVLLFGLLKDDV